MRRTTSGTILEQAKLLRQLLKDSPEEGIRHHAEDVFAFFLFLHEKAKITHTVSRTLREKQFPHPHAFLDPGATGDLPSRIAASRKRLISVLGEISDRKIKIAVLDGE